MAKGRMIFLDEMQQFIVDGLKDQGIAETTTRRCLHKWHEGQDAIGPIEHGCFHCFHEVQANYEKVLSPEDLAAHNAEIDGEE